MNRVKGQGVPDFVLMDQITEDAMMENLKIRFQTDNIYTYIGSVVVAINPYRRIESLFSAKNMAEYKGRQMYEVPPHIYALANDAYANMLRTQDNQCVIISGESGAGKTESSKIFMQYIAAVSKSSTEVDRVKNQLLDSNPILEAFGNAKTIRNDNSSRFGKYMEIQFEKDGSPSGGQISNYLLEKSRVVLRAKGERSFHIFYQLLSGLGGDLARLELVNDPSKYAYLAHSECGKVDTIDDAADFKLVQKSFNSFDFHEKERSALWRALAGILHLGNVTIVEGKSSGPVKVQFTNEQALNTAASLFQCDAPILKRALSSRTISTGVGSRQSIITVPLDANQALYTRDALAKSIYERIFNWIVETINNKLVCKTNSPKLVIGVLDIYGFEVFDNNSFEQFCINLCNEKLQQLFIELTLKSEQEEYLAEGIQWEPVKYFNNKVICDLIEGKPVGIISLLDECCLIADSTDTTFLDKMENNFKSHAHFQTYKTTQDRKIPDGCFRLKHYAGDVTYNVSGFLDKNKDTLFVDLVNCMCCSSNSLLVHLFPPPDINNKKRPLTAAVQFKNALATLMAKLLSCQPHYIRCIKPNDNKRAGVFDEPRIRHQVRYLGLLENVRVRRAGFAYRQTYDRFLWRYKMITKETWPRWRGDSKSGAQQILNSMGIKPEEYRMGKTKVFIRNPTTLFFLEEKRELELPRIATLLQTQWRAYICRAQWAKKKAAIKIRLWYVKNKFRPYIMAVGRAFKDVKNDTKNWGKFVEWPRHPSSLDHGVVLLRKVWANWRAKMMIKSLTPEGQAHMRQKVLAYNLFKGKKPWSVPRKFDADYLALDSNPHKDKYVEAMQSLFSTYGDTQVMFADYVMKLNPVGKMQPRGLVVTEKNIYKHHAKNYKVQKFGTPIVEINSISLSSKKDTFVVIHCNSFYRDLVVDLGVNGEERYSEFVSILVREYKKLKGSSLTVNFVDKITYNNQRTNKKPGTNHTLSFEASSDPKLKGSTYKSGKAGNDVILYAN